MLSYIGKRTENNGIIKYMPKSMTEIVTESHEESRRYDCSTGMELPTVWGNVRCIGTCDGRSV